MVLFSLPSLPTPSQPVCNTPLLAAPFLGPAAAFQLWVGSSFSPVTGIVQPSGEKTWFPSHVHRAGYPQRRRLSKQIENDANSSPYNLVPINLKLFENSNEIFN